MQRAFRNVCSIPVPGSKGQIVGYYSYDTQGNKPLFFDNSGANPLPMKTGEYTNIIANSINWQEEIVGSSRSVADGIGFPVYWSSPTADPSPLQEGSFSNSNAVCINSRSQIVGDSRPYIGPNFPIYWSSPSGQPSRLSISLNKIALSGFYVIARGMNAFGQIVGFYIDTGNAIPLYWSSPTADPVVLNTLSYTNVRARSINYQGQIVGYYTDTNDHPLYWSSPTSEPSLLSTGSTPSISATGINHDGQIIGTGYPPQTYLWSSYSTGPSEILVDYAYPIPFSALCINDTNYIVGTTSDTYEPSYILISNNEFPDPICTLPQPLLQTGFNTLQVNSINNAYVIVGAGIRISGRYLVPLIWNDLNSDPQQIKIDDSYSIFNVVANSNNDSGNIVGKYNDADDLETPLYWDSSMASPKQLSKIDTDGKHYLNVLPTGIDNFGTIVGYCNSGDSGFPIYWVNSADTSFNYLSTKDEDGNNYTNVVAYNISTNGKIVGFKGNRNPEKTYNLFYWDSIVSPITPLSNGGIPNLIVTSINSDGAFVGKDGKNSYIWESITDDLRGPTPVLLTHPFTSIGVSIN